MMTYVLPFIIIVGGLLMLLAVLDDDA